MDQIIPSNKVWIKTLHFPVNYNAFVMELYNIRGMSVKFVYNPHSGNSCVVSQSSVFLCFFIINNTLFVKFAESLRQK